MKYLLIIFFIIVIQLPVLAQEYVLPYPGPMPGNKLYMIMSIIDRIQGWWSWGSIARTRYHLNLADKHLVEAKILLEYKQYLLGVEALKKSNQQFDQLDSQLIQIFAEGKDLQPYYSTILAASVKHQEVLEQLIVTVPVEFHWTPEKQEGTQLRLQEELKAAIKLRNQTSVDLQAFKTCIQSISSTITPKKVISENCWKERDAYKNISVPVLQESEPYM